MHITQSLSHVSAEVTFEVENPSLTLCIEAIDHFKQFAPQHKAEAIRLFCNQAKISQAKFAHLDRLLLTVEGGK